MRVTGWMIVWFGVLGISSTDAHAQTVSQPKLHPHMLQLLEDLGPSKGWVYFEDKGIRGKETLRASLREARLALHPRTKARRKNRRERPGLVDMHDLPVHQGYVDQVLATGAELSIESKWLNAVSVHGTVEQFQAIAELPFVRRIEPVRRGVLVDGWDAAQASPLEQPGGREETAAPPAFYGLSADQLIQLNLLAVHDRGYTGSGVVIGILDTGFHRGHEAFNQSGHVVDVITEWDFVDNDSFTGKEVGDDPSQHSHGTYILGTIGAYLPNELVGGAYDASFILCKTEDITNEYQQEEDFYVAGLEFIETNGGDMATSSLGYIDWYTQSQLDGLTAVTTICVNIATSNGMHCCTAAGNDFHDSDPSTSALIAPSDAFQVITCGAADFQGTIVSFSSDGPSADGRVKPELLARGLDTWTVCSNTDTNCTAPINGTSLSTPLIAAMVGCLVQAHPNWTPGQLRARLFDSASDFRANGTFDPLFVRGYGIPDADLAGFERARRRSDSTPLGPIFRTE